MLKGADILVYMVGISLGLPVLVKPVTEDVDIYICDEDEWKTSRYVLPKFQRLIVGGTRGDDESAYDEFYKHTFQGALGDKNITWCQALSNLQPAATFTAVYGNEPGWSEVVYQAAAILVCVPKWRKRSTTVVEPQQCSCGEQLEPCRKKCKSESDSNISAAFGGPDIQELLCPGSD